MVIALSGTSRRVCQLTIHILFSSFRTLFHLCWLHREPQYSYTSKCLCPLRRICKVFYKWQICAEQIWLVPCLVTPRNCNELVHRPQWACMSNDALDQASLLWREQWCLRMDIPALGGLPLVRIPLAITRSWIWFREVLIWRDKVSVWTSSPRFHLMELAPRHLWCWAAKRMV